LMGPRVLDVVVDAVAVSVDRRNDVVAAANEDADADLVTLSELLIVVVHRRRRRRRVGVVVVVQRARAGAEESHEHRETSDSVTHGYTHALDPDGTQSGLHGD